MDGEVEYDPEWSTTHLVLNTIFSAVFAGAVAVLVTAVIERWGGTLGGILGTVPGTIVPMTVGVAIQADTNYTKIDNALYVIPLGMTSAVFFLLLWRVIPPYFPKSWNFQRRLITMICVSLFGWLCWSTVLYLGLSALQRAGFTIPQVGICGAIALFLAGLAGACYRPVPSPKGTNKVTPLVYLARSTIAATSVGLAVLVSKWSDVLAGIFACFPAIFLTTMVSLWISQGEAMPTGAVGPMMLGSGAVYIYAIAFAGFFPYFNDRWALPYAVVSTTVCAWFFSVLVSRVDVHKMSVPIYFGLKWRQRCSPSLVDAGHRSVEVEEDEAEHYDYERDHDDHYDDDRNDDRLEEETLGLKSHHSSSTATSYYGAIKH